MTKAKETDLVFDPLAAGQETEKVAEKSDAEKQDDDRERHGKDKEYHSRHLTVDEIAYLRRNILVH